MPMCKHTPLGYRAAVGAEARCVVQTVRLLRTRRIRIPRTHVGTLLEFADGTSARVYRETALVGQAPADPCLLLVSFRLIGARGWGHRLFEWESLFNTPLFVGFPGFISKLWLAHDQRDFYRGVYEWDGPQRAESYARALWRVLALVSRSSSIQYMVVPGLTRESVLHDPSLLDGVSADAAAWWRLIKGGSAPAGSNDECAE